jgi:hypothetical protein
MARMLKRSLVGVIALLLLALAPLSVSAAGSTSQKFTATVDITSISGSCTTPAASGATNLVATAAGVVNDTGVFDLSLDLDGPFPNQVVGEFGFQGAHSQAEIEYTGTMRCPDSQTLIINGQVWTGQMYDDATGTWYTINGAGRGNSITIKLGPNGFSATFSGTAKVTAAPVER